MKKALLVVTWSGVISPPSRSLSSVQWCGGPLDKALGPQSVKNAMVPATAHQSEPRPPRPGGGARATDQSEAEHGPGEGLVCRKSL